MRNEPSFESVRDRLAAGTESAAEHVSRSHFERIVRLVQVQLNRKYQSKVGAEDIANSALKSFFLRFDGYRDGLADWEGLWTLLAHIAMNKLRRRVRDLGRKKRDVSREVPVPALGAGPAVGGRDGEPAAAPDEEVVIRDLCDHLLGDCSADKRRVIDLALKGYTVEETVALSALSDRTVCRVRKQFKLRLEAERDADPD